MKILCALQHLRFRHLAAEALSELCHAPARKPEAALRFLDGRVDGAHVPGKLARVETQRGHKVAYYIV